MPGAMLVEGTEDMAEAIMGDPAIDTVTAITLRNLRKGLLY